MEERKSQRKPSNFYASISSNQLLCSGIITDLSKGGMYIKTQEKLPVESELHVSIPMDLLLPSKGKELKISAKVVRSIEIDDRYHGMGVEILNPQAGYLELVDNHRAEFES